MRKIAVYARENAEWLILIALVSLWSLVWDPARYGDFQRMGRIKLFLGCAVLVAALRISREWHRSIACLYALMCGSYLYFGFRPWLLPIGEKSMLFELEGFEEILCVTATLLLVPRIAYLVKRHTFENATMVSSVVHAVLGVGNMFGLYLIPQAKTPEADLPIGLLGQQTLLGPFLAFAGFISLLRSSEVSRREEKIGYIGVGAFLMVIAILTRSSMTYGSIIAGGGVWLVFRYGWRTAAGGGMFAGFALFIAQQFDHNVLWHSGRTEPWLDALSLLRLRPFIGFGVGSWEPIAEGIKQVRGYQFAWSYLHSEPVQAVFEFGAIGGLLMCWIASAVFGRLHLIFLFRDRSCLVWAIGLAVFGANSLANFTLHVMPHGAIFALCVFHILRSLSKAPSAVADR